MDANQLLMGSGSASAKFETIGTTIGGRIVAPPEARQQTDFQTQVPLTWPNGDPKMQVLVQVQTAQRDPGNPQDDGVRTVYVKGKSLTDAVRAAVRAAGANGLEVGGTLTVTYTGDGERQKGFSAPKLYSAAYVPPAAQAANAVLMSGTAEPSSPQAANGAAPAPPPGVDAAVWERMDAGQRQAVLAAMGNVAPY